MKEVRKLIQDKMIEKVRELQGDAALAGYLVIGGALFHQGVLRLPSISKITKVDEENKMS